MTALLSGRRRRASRSPVVLLAFLLLVLAVALVGGLWPALASPRCSAGWPRTGSSSTPTGRLTVRRVDDVVVAGRRSGRGRRRRDRRGPLGPAGHRRGAVPRRDRDARLAVPLGAGRRPRPARAARADPRGVRAAVRWRWSSGRADGDARRRHLRPAPDGPTRRTTDDVAVTDTLVLRLSGRTAARASERRVLVAFAEQAAVALQQGRLAAAGRRGRPARRGQQHAHRAAGRGQPRPAHPAGRDQGGRPRRCAPTTSTSTDADRAELVATIDESADRLDRPGRQPARHEPAADRRGQPALSPTDARPRSCTQALGWLDGGRAAPGSRCDWPDDLPAVLADPGLLERVVANLVEQRAAARARPARSR